MSQKERMHELLYSNDGRVELCERICKLEAENAKLCELVLELYEMAQPEAPSMFEAEFADRLRELGVEVKP